MYKGRQISIIISYWREVAKAIIDPGPQWNLYGHIVEDTRGVLNNLRSWFVGHVKREANFGAHSLAKEAVKNVLDQIWLEEVLIVSKMLLL
jgi:hypothetical protein